MDRSVLVFLLTVLACCFGQKIIPQTVISQGHDGVCPSAEESAAIREQISKQVLSLLNISSESPDQPPCPCGGPGQWTRIAHLDMSDPSQQCPSNWNLVTTPVRGCGKSTTSGCNSVTFSSTGQSYSRVCGRITAYQRGTTDAFIASLFSASLEGAYVEGVSLTHGPAGSRQHIWTFAAAVYEGASYPTSRCPCTYTTTIWPYTVPGFVANTYFCDTGNPGPDVGPGVYADDPLWDGEGCGPTSTCCEFNNPPWFCTTLPQPTTNDIEARICVNSDDEDVIISLVDIFVI